LLAIFSTLKDVDWYKKDPISPVLGFFDGHTSRISPEVFDTALQHNFIMITFPPNTTHKLQVSNIMKQ
jgi:hypothetical protein